MRNTARYTAGITPSVNGPLAPEWSVWSIELRLCPHDTFPNRVRSIATSSRPVARVHTGATRTLVPVSRDHLATWNERARSVTPCRVRRVDAQVGARVRSLNHLLLSHASLTHFFRDLCNCHTLGILVQYLTLENRNPAFTCQ